jgi:hypothetical protein
MIKINDHVSGVYEPLNLTRSSEQPQDSTLSREEQLKQVDLGFRNGHTNSIKILGDEAHRLPSP